MIAGHGGGARGSCGCGGRRGRGQRFACPGCREVVDAALVVKAGVVCEVVLHGHVAVAGGLELVACVVDRAGQEGRFVVGEVFLHSRAEEVEVRGAVALRGAAYACEVLREDLFLEAVDCIGDAL